MNERFRLIVRDDTPWESARLRAALIILGADVLLFALAVFAFVYVQYGIVRRDAGLGIVSPRSGSPYVMTPDFAGADNGGDAGRFSFPGRFNRGEPHTLTEGDTLYYYDSTCELSITTYSLSTGPAYVADIYVADIARLAAPLANGQYGKGQREDALELANREGALFAVTGDNYSERYGGAVLRDGVLYAREVYRDVCVLNWDGTVDIHAAGAFDLKAVMDKNPYQIWSFGPALVVDSEMPDSFDTDMLAPGRRAAFGYFEPGHYCLVLMEGEAALESLAETMRALGCESAYALYGGSVARMIYDGAEVNIPQEARRPCSDLITITK